MGIINATGAAGALLTKLPFGRNERRYPVARWKVQESRTQGFVSPGAQ